MHVRVMLLILWLLAAHFVDVAGPWIFQSRGLSTANVVDPVTPAFVSVLGSGVLAIFPVSASKTSHRLCAQPVLGITTVVDIFGRMA